MAEIIAPKDCGNSPKKLFLKDFIAAIANDDREFASRSIYDKTTWRLVEGQEEFGGSEIMDGLKKHPVRNACRIEIESIITHGTDAAVHGRITTTNGAKFAFCDVYKFKGHKGFEIRAVKSFLHPVKA